MTESPRRLVSIDNLSKKENLEMSAAESDQKDDSQANTYNLNVQSDLMSETSDIDNETAPSIESTESGVESSVEVSDLSKNESLNDFIPETVDKEIYVFTPVSTEEKQQLSTELDSDKSPSLPQGSTHEINNKECSSVVTHSEQPLIKLDSEFTSSSEIRSEECSSLVQEQQARTDLELSLSPQSSNSFHRLANEEVTDNVADVLDEKSLHLLSTLTSMTSNKEYFVPSLISAPPFTKLHQETSQSLAPISSETSIPEDYVLPSTPSEPPSTDLCKGISIGKLVSLETTNRESSPSTIPLEQPSTKLDEEIPIFTISSSDVTNKKSSISSAILSEKQSTGFGKEIQPTVPSLPSNTTNWEDSVSSSVSSEQATRLKEIQLALPTTSSEAANKEVSVPLTVSSEKSTGINVEMPVYISSSSEINNKECSSFLPEAQPCSETSTLSPTTSEAVSKEIFISEEQTEALAKRLLEQVTTIKVTFENVKEIEYHLDNRDLRCQCNATLNSTDWNSSACRQCPGSVSMYLYAQEAKHTISEMFVQLQKIYSWFRFFENIDDRFKVRMTDVENLHKALSEILKKFDRCHW